jgi:toxin ParE1/3/4
MSHRLIVRSEAEADITEAALWYEGRAAGLGLELTAEIRRAIQRAVERPLTCLRFRKHPEVRRILARRFPYRVFCLAHNKIHPNRNQHHAIRNHKH